MANRLKHETRKMILRLLCEGNSIRSTSRLTGCHTKTIGNVILQFGNASRTFMADMFQDLSLKHVEVDEMWTFCGKKQARLTVEEKATRHDIGDQYLFTGIDKDTKLIPVHLVGKRSADNCRRFMMNLAGCFKFPNPHAADNHAYTMGSYKPVVQISTDGFAGYPEAVDLAFGPYAKFGVIVKQYKNARMQYDPSEMIATKREVRKGNISEWSIVTSHIERHNLTVRTFMKRFTRLSLGFSKKLECLEAACGMFLAYYNFIWRTRHKDDSGKRGKLRPPAAMMAGVVDKLWNFDDLYDTVICYG